MDAADDTVREGGCRCGAHRFRTTGKPKWVAHCHCNDCRRSTGAAFSTWTGFRSERFSWLGAAPTVHELSPRTFRTFCARCGTSLTFVSDRWKDEVHILVGTFDDPATLVPRAHVYVRDKLPWVHLGDGLKFATTAAEGPPLP